MTNELLDKIRKTLTDTITQEKDVVYLLVEIRKLIDRENYQDAVIRAFANWVVHTELSNKHDGTTEVLEGFDILVKLFAENATSKRLPMHFNFYDLERRLRKLLTHFKLPTELLNEQQWNNFIFLYAAIVSDCPITIKASKLPLKYIKELELKGYPSESDLKWKVVLKDGETSCFSAREATFEPPLRKRTP